MQFMKSQLQFQQEARQILSFLMFLAKAWRAATAGKTSDLHRSTRFRGGAACCGVQRKASSFAVRPAQVGGVLLWMRTELSEDNATGHSETHRLLVTLTCHQFGMILMLFDVVCRSFVVFMIHRLSRNDVPRVPRIVCYHFFKKQNQCCFAALRSIL